MAHPTKYSNVDSADKVNGVTYSIITYQNFDPMNELTTSWAKKMTILNPFW